MWLFTSALASTICVPDLFQHWDCDQTAPTVADAVAHVATTSAHTIHVRWDVVETGQLVIPDQVELNIVGHRGATGVPTLGPVQIDQDAALRLENVLIAVPVGVDGLKVHGDLTVEDLRVEADFDGFSASRAVLVSGTGSLTATRLAVGRWSTNLRGGQLSLWDEGTAICTDCEFQEGTANAGGAIAVTDNSWLQLRGGVVQGASADDEGGGALWMQDGMLDVAGTVFRGNYAEGVGGSQGGGALRVLDGVAHIDGALFCDNASLQDGGAIWVTSEATVRVQGSLFYSNSTDDDGAAVFTRNGGEVFFLHNTVASNSGGADHGLRREAAAVLDVSSSLFVGHEDQPAVRNATVLTNNLAWPAVPDTVNFNPAVLGNYEGFDPQVQGGECSLHAFRPLCDAAFPVTGAGEYLPHIGAAGHCRSEDLDGDGLMAHEEVARGTSDQDPDSDGDGLSDALECPPAITAPLNNPSFEMVGLVGAVHGQFHVYADDVVPGWSNGTADEIHLAPDAAYPTGVPDGIVGLAVRPGDLITQTLQTEPAESLVLKLVAVNTSADTVTFEVTAGQGSYFLNLAANTTTNVAVPVEFSDEVGVVSFSSTGGTALIDALYLGPQSDLDADGVLSCLDHDSDGDLLSDADEVAFGTDPQSDDTDGDGVGDSNDADPLTSDLDQDGLPDWFERVIGTQIDHADSDGDSFTDGEECPMVGGINGGFEVVIGDEAGLLLPSLVPGWSSHTNDQVEVIDGLSSDFPPAASGARYAQLNGTTPGEFVQTVDLPGDVFWSYQHRGRLGLDEIVFAAGPAHEFSHQADTLSWTVHSGVLEGETGLTEFRWTSTVTEPTFGNLIDDFVVMPLSNFTGAPSADYASSLRCNDAAVGPGGIDGDGDGVPFHLDCDDQDPLVGGVEQRFMDDDGDGFGSDVQVLACAGSDVVEIGGDCDDQDGDVFPGQGETCNGIDDNCDEHIDEHLAVFSFYEDVDGDDFGGSEVQACSQPPGTITVGGDCDDTDPHVNPDAHEVCNGVDDDCAQGEDDGLPLFTYYLDVDGDGFGHGAVQSCETAAPVGLVVDGGDCDDSSNLTSPGVDETCEPIDRNCDGQHFAGAVGTVDYYFDADGDDYGDPDTSQSSCVPPVHYVVDNTDCADFDPDIHPGAHEICNFLDDDCDEEIDENGDTPFYLDHDGDGYGTGTAVLSCVRPEGFAEQPGDCDDDEPFTFPGAMELCDTLDNDCDEHIDEDVVDVQFYTDHDGDGFGDAPSVVSCAAPPGSVLQNGDCDDSDRHIHPSAVETCNGVDNNCFAGEADAVDPDTYFFDEDQDGFGSGDAVLTCEQGDLAEAPGDCDDVDPSVSPAATEVCDGIDNDCDGINDIDAENPTVWFIDEDSDGFTDPSSPTVVSCDEPSPLGGVAFVATALPGDCDDQQVAVNPAAAEICDGVDNDCDGDVDLEDAGLVDPIVERFEDGDGDGFGTSATFSTCDPSEGSTTPDDCDDTDGAVFPGAVEICDGVDNDCDGELDPPTGFVDADGDGFGDPTQPECGGVDNPLDCNDEDPLVNPNAEEIFGDPIDQDCDGLAPQEDQVVPLEEDLNLKVSCSSVGPAFTGWFLLALVSSRVRRRSP